MLPNWLLGKSKSKLQEILGGGGGGTTYTAGEGIDITNHEISVDPLLMNDIEQTALAIPTKAAKTQLSNPNILHNPWFTVNQRGSTSVTANGLFIADRWYCYSPVSFEITRDGNGNIVINNASIANYSAIIQKRTTTYINSLNGMKLTASIMLSDGTIKSGTITFNSSGNTQKYYEDDDMVAYVLPSANQLFGLNVKAGASVTIKALKLEIGEISTLARDPRPEYAIELAKCQRYFIRFNSLLFAPGTVHNNGAFRFIIHTKMRAQPTVSIHDAAMRDLQVICNQSAQRMTDSQTISVQNYTTEEIVIQFDSLPTPQPDSSIGLFKLLAGALDLDAEL